MDGFAEQSSEAFLGWLTSYTRESYDCDLSGTPAVIGWSGLGLL
jgi:hypothetical protein